MFSKSSNVYSTPVKSKSVYTFKTKKSNKLVTIERVIEVNDCDLTMTQSVLVNSFTTEYGKYLSPQDIRSDLISWDDGEYSVKKYYEDYFTKEINQLAKGAIDYWVQAKIDGKVVGWATFLIEKPYPEKNANPTAVYMDLLIVDPSCQGEGIGEQLVKSLLNLKIAPELDTIHLLLRKKNKGGRTFYTKLGFYSDPSYSRDDNFVDKNKIEGFTWKNPALQDKMQPVVTVVNRM